MGKLKWIVLMVLAGLVLAPVAGAQRSSGVQGSMLVTGNVDIEPDGRVSGWQLDKRRKLPVKIASLIDAAVEGWRFEPVLVDGQAAAVKARMHLRLVAKEHESGDFAVSIRHAYFGQEAEDLDYSGDRSGRTDVVLTVEKKRINYPRWAANQNISGTAYVRIRIDRDGRVAEALAEQVNLRRSEGAGRMRKAREEFAEAALEGIREWRFSVPTTGDEANKPYWDGRIAVNFNLEDLDYGKWEVYVPGPVTRAPWADDDIGPNASPDVMVAGGGFQQTKPSLKLLTPLEDG